MDVLLTNDDGIQAEGLAALHRACEALGATVWTVAPATEQSMCGHRVTTYSPIAVEQRGERAWAVTGTPADCVRIALFALNLKPSWVLSGINHGGNLGQDAHISGTLAAAREAAYHGMKAIGFSHYLIAGLALDWQRLSRWTAEVWEELQTSPLADGRFWSVNFPHLPSGEVPLPARRVCVPARSPMNVGFKAVPGGYQYEASYAARPRDPGSDVEACFGGDVAITQLSV
jgi:5'-nucleotidase